jgi:dihydrofolate synthase / folylpolyglutamate synthase
VTTPNFPYYNTIDQIYHVEVTTALLARQELLRQSIRMLWPNGHPTKLVHVVGTSGKGSTSRFLEMGFSCVGKSGALMSPHLFDYRERFSVNGEFVSQDDIMWAWHERIQPHCVQLALQNPQHTHTFLGVSILMGLALFEKHGVAWAAWEAGIGGRYDQTRALDVEATVLTNVGSDHANLLGKEQWQRVLDKAGAARPGKPFFTSDTNPDNVAIIRAVCRDAGSPLTEIGQFEIEQLTAQLAALPGSGDQESLIQARYQKWNAALSLAVVRHFYPELAQREIVSRFTQARLLGRLWQVAERLYADIAHNAEKISALTGELTTRFADQGKILVIGLSGHRAARQVFAGLARVAKAIIVTSASYKGQDPETVRSDLAPIMGETPLLVVPDPQQALHLAQTMQGANDVVILTGSTYAIEQALNPDPYLRYLSASFGWRAAVDSEAHGTVQLTLPKPKPGIR